MDETRDTKHSGCAAVVVMLIVMLVLAYAGGYAYYRSRRIWVGDRDVMVMSMVLDPPAGKAVFYLYYPAAWIEAHVRGGELLVGAPPLELIVN